MYSSHLIVFIFTQLIGLVFCKITPDTNILLASPDGGDIVVAAGQEPTCEELRRMWRHTKREMQQQRGSPPNVATAGASEASTSSVRVVGGGGGGVGRVNDNYRLRYHEPFSYGLKAQARSRNAMYAAAQPIYGRLVHSPDKFLNPANVPTRYRSFDQVARMVGSSNGYYPAAAVDGSAAGGAGAKQQKPMYFRLDYPMRRHPLPTRIVHVGRFQELKQILRNDRANELQQKKKLKNGGDQTSSLNGDSLNNSEPGYDTTMTYRFQSAQSQDDDFTAENSKGRKLRDADKNGSDAESVFEDGKFGENDENESDSSGGTQSTDKPVAATWDDSIPRRWALGEWRRR